MTILEELLKTTESSDLDTKLKVICDKIMSEEFGSIKPTNVVIGPNIFLSIPIDRLSSICLCLEREEVGKYIFSLKKKNHRNIYVNEKVWKYDGLESAEFVLKGFAKKLKFLRGE